MWDVNLNDFHFRKILTGRSPKFVYDYESEMATKLLWIAGSRNTTPSFIPGLRKKEYQVETVQTGVAALARIPGLNPNLVVVDAASRRTSGRRICRALRDLRDDLPILLICDGSQTNGSVTANQVLVLPFTLRKLVNRIRALVPQEGEKALEAGGLTFYPESNKVRSAGGELQQLTPLLAALLKAFVEHPGEVVERERLFREVWRTDYVKDTRTLDVHMSWLRGKIEANPRKPRLLKTVRGVGFRLDV
jgi:DNA-binding response OmpR family regulator